MALTNGSNTAVIGFEQQIWAAADILGRTYEYYLSKFAEQEGKRAGQPFKGRVYDPCCGSGRMFVQSADLLEDGIRKRLGAIGFEI